MGLFQTILTELSHQYEFKVYDLKWKYIDTFWAATDYGLKEIGDYVKDNTKSKYDGTVYIKRVE
jgi:hypothetical protein